MIRPVENKKIYLIRHGRTTANEERRYCGVTGVSLSEEGRAAILEMRDYYQNLISDKANYFTSGMKRANQTFEILFEKDGKLPRMKEVPGFKEINFGVFEGYTYDELRDDPKFITWLDGDYEKNIPPEGESGDQMSQRILTAFEEFVKYCGEEAVIIGHGGTAYYIMRYLFPDENKTLWDWDPKNGCGYMLEYRHREWSYKKIGLNWDTSDWG